MPRRTPAALALTFAAALFAATLGARALAASSVSSTASAQPAHAAADPAACPRVWRLDLGASLDTVGAGRYDCPGCDGAITDGERMSAAGRPLEPQRVIVTAAGDEDRILWDGMLDHAASPATRSALVALCEPPPYDVYFVGNHTSGSPDAWLCPNSPGSRRIDDRDFQAHGRRLPLPVSFRLWRCDDHRTMGGVIVAIHCWISFPPGGAETCFPPQGTPTPRP